MRVAVFASQYPARAAGYVARDLGALRDAGAEIEVFAVRPASGDGAAGHGPAAPPVHHLSLRSSAGPAASLMRARASACLRDGGALLAATARAGIGPLVRTAYVLPKAWAWAARAGARFDHVLATRGDHVAACAHAFHRQLPRRVPFTLCVHGGNDLQRRPAALRRTLLYADTVLTCSRSNRDVLAGHWPELRPALDAKLQVFPHGLDLAEYPYAPADRTPRHLLGVGPFRTGRGLETLLRAVFLLRIRGIDVTVDLVGDGPDRQHLHGLAGRLGLTDGVRIRDEAATAALAAAALLVYPSAGGVEGIPRVVREAMALGTPVVATRAGGLPETLDEGCGLLVPPRDEGALADAIGLLLGDPGLRRRTAARARCRAEERFDAWKNGVRLADLLWDARHRC